VTDRSPIDDRATVPSPGGDQAVRLAEELMSRPRPWLICVDVDGTLSPIVARPERARLLPGAADALHALATREDAWVVVVSGRPLDDLRHLFEIPKSVMLVGSHGAEFDLTAGLDESPRPKTAEETERLNAVTALLDRAVRVLEGAWVEHKPFAVALHYRLADPTAAAPIVVELDRVLHQPGDLTIHHGHMVLEIAVRRTSKNGAVRFLRERLHPATVVFVGDDESDEHVMEHLSAEDIGVKVGGGDTAASHRLRSPHEVVLFLTAVTAR
jgi:trehalose 6-phosphate phosphatase